MAIGTRVIWAPVPANCTFNLRAVGDEHLFNISASVSVNGTSRPQLRHQDIVPGPAPVTITEVGQRWVIKPTVFLSADPDDPVLVEAWLEQPDGTIVQIPNGVAGAIEARCQWEIDDDAIPLRIKISVKS